MKISVRIIHASSYYRNVPVSRKGTLHQTYSEGRSFERDSSIQRTLWPLKPSLLENDMQINKFFLHQSIQVHCRVYVLDSHYSGSFFPHLEFSLFLSFFPALIW
ncbi:uncharacterized protein [Glycine max]|uniref:uncharacterized protein isoform X1 n=1 Tax=Glycine max TaxID=3847 RepID=UPI001B356800|nr:uncharacterized protein LOC113001455 isoform X1 [Glycine max]